MPKWFEKFVDWLFDLMTGGGIPPNRELPRKIPTTPPRPRGYPPDDIQ